MITIYRGGKLEAARPAACIEASQLPLKIPAIVVPIHML